MKLTKAMRTALNVARRGPLRRVHNPNLPGKPHWPAHHSTLAALVRHELVNRQEIKNRRGHRVDLWTITAAGRQALEPVEVHRDARPVYLAHPQTDVGGDYTTDPRRRIDDAEVTDPDHLEEHWQRDAAERQAQAETPRARARRLARNARARKPGPVTIRHVDPATLRDDRAA